MNELLYKEINLNKLPAEVFLQFKHYTKEDKSLVLIRYKDEHAVIPTIEECGTTFGGSQLYQLSVPKLKTQVESTVIICRTSANHYVVIGTNDKYSRIGYGKNIEEVGAFIKRHFCRTLLD